MAIYELDLRKETEQLYKDLPSSVAVPYVKRFQRQGTLDPNSPNKVGSNKDLIREIRTRGKEAKIKEAMQKVARMRIARAEARGEYIDYNDAVDGLMVEIAHETGHHEGVAQQQKEAATAQRIFDKKVNGTFDDYEDAVLGPAELAADQAKYTEMRRKEPKFRKVYKI